MPSTVTSPAQDLQSTVFLDSADLTELATTGTLWFSLGDQRFELHTGPRPSVSDFAVRLTPKRLEALQASGEIAFRRPWGRLVVAMELEAAR